MSLWILLTAAALLAAGVIWRRRSGSRAALVFALLGAAGLASVAAWLGIAVTPPPAPPASLRPPVRSRPVARKPAPQKLDGRVAIRLGRFSGAGRLKLKAISTLRLFDSRSGRQLLVVQPGTSLEATPVWASGAVRLATPRGPMTRRELELRGSLIQIGRSRYPESVHLRLAGTGIEAINRLDIETYLQGVLPGELPSRFHIEAQKALAVAARSYTLAQREKHEDSDLCDGTHCQMYVGLRRASSRALAALAATRRQVLKHQGRICTTFYSADCGGRSTSAEHVPLRDKPHEGPISYLRPVIDRAGPGDYFCSHSPFHTWTVTLDERTLARKLAEETGIPNGRVIGLTVLQRDPSGYVLSIKADVAASDSDPPSMLPAALPFTMTGWRFRNLAGAYTLRTTRFQIHAENGNFVFNGAGNGHGLGLCQYGADGMGQRGFNYRQILAHYYPGSRLTGL